MKENKKVSLKEWEEAYKVLKEINYVSYDKDKHVNLSEYLDRELNEKVEIKKTK